MSVLLIEKSPFEAAIGKVATQTKTGTNVRRPLYGVSRKEARFAFLSLYQVNSR